MTKYQYDKWDLEHYSMEVVSKCTYTAPLTLVAITRACAGKAIFD